MHKLFNIVSANDVKEAIKREGKDLPDVKKVTADILNLVDNLVIDDDNEPAPENIPDAN